MAPIRFGPFEADPRSGELRHKGARVKLQEQPFQVLVLLLERSGEVVTREELTRRLWPDNTFVDFERGLNKAISRLRDALKDNAEKPKFIETLPQHGYRFIAPVEKVAAGSDGKSETRPAGFLQKPRIDSVAVLPLENLSDDATQEYFSDGMTEELITAISKIDFLRVISRTSVMLFKGARKSLPAIARELRVDALVEGSVSRAGDKVRITAQLIHGPDDRHLWSGRFEREIGDILQMQAEIAERIAEQIQKVIDPTRKTPAAPRKVHPPAYEACLKGIYIRDKMTPMDLAKSISHFEDAIKLDPGYGQAHGELSQTYFYLGLFGMGPPSEFFPKAKASAVRALELDDHVAAAHNALAVIRILYEWDWTGAEAECRRATELNPNDSVAHIHFADYMSIQARHEEAIAEYRRGLELDPISRLYVGFFAMILHRARRYDEAIEQCKKALEIDPDYANAFWFLAISLEQKGQLTESIEKLEHVTSLSPAMHFRALLGRAYALAGKREKAERILGELEAQSKRQYVSPFDIAVVHTGLGNLGCAFEWFEEAYRQRVFRLIELTLPMFDSLRSDMRWQDLVRRIGLPR